MKAKICSVVNVRANPDDDESVVRLVPEEETEEQQHQDGCIDQKFVLSYPKETFLTCLILTCLQINLKKLYNIDLQFELDRNFIQKVAKKFIQMMR